MYKFTKPGPATLKVQDGKGGSFPVPYPFESYLGEYVWCYSKWNTDDSWGDAQERIGALAEEAPDGGDVVLSLDDMEKLREANKAAEIKGPHAHKIRRLQKAVKAAVKYEPS